MAWLLSAHWQNYCKIPRCLRASDSLVSAYPLIFIALIHRSIVHQYASPSFCCFAFQSCCVVPAYAIPYLHPSLRAYPILGFVRAGHFALFPQILGELIVLYIPLKNCPARTPIQNNSDLFTNVSISVNMHYQWHSAFGITFGPNFHLQSMIQGEKYLQDHIHVFSYSMQVYRNTPGPSQSKNAGMSIRHSNPHQKKMLTDLTIGAMNRSMIH